MNPKVMTALQHRVRAEELLGRAEDRMERLDGQNMDHQDALVQLASVQVMLVRAEVHASLARTEG